MTSKSGARYVDRAATVAQRRCLDRLGLTYGSDITAAAATDLIGTTLPAEPETVEILKFFRITSKGMTQTDARKRLAEVIANTENKRKWGERPASKDQTDCMEFFKQVIPSGLTHSAAEKLVRDLLADETKANAWDAEVDRRELAESEMDDFIDLVADYATDYECRKPSKKLARATLRTLLADGLTIEQIEAQHYAPFFQLVATLDPAIVKDEDKFRRQLAAVAAR